MLHKGHDHIMQEMAERRHTLRTEAHNWRLLNAHKPYQPELYRRLLNRLGITLVRVGQRLEQASSEKRYPAYTPELGKLH